jgi:hypothetical protein
MGAEDGVASHRFMARRDVEMLASSIHLSLELHRTGEGAKVVAVLANLAGHGTPAGSGRRAIEVRAWGEDELEARVIARLTPVRPGMRDPAWSDALAPGEVRRIELPELGPLVRVGVTYVRDVRNPTWHQVEIARESMRLTP